MLYLCLYIQTCFDKTLYNFSIIHYGLLLIVIFVCMFVCLYVCHKMQEDQGKGTNTSVDLTQEEAQNDNLGGNSENDTGQA